VSFRKWMPPVGARPGTLAIPEGSPAPRIHVMRWRPEGVEEHEVADAAGLEAVARGPEPAWVDVHGLGDETVLRRVADLFGIHPLALEDAVNAPQRAKVEPYDHHLLVVARMPELAEDGAIAAPQLCLLLGERHLLTFQERFFGWLEPVRARLRAGRGPIRERGPDYLAYAVLDTLVDRYFPVAENLSARLDELEDAAMEADDPETLNRIHVVRRQVTVLRRVGWPQREAVGRLVREPLPFVSDEVRTYLRDTEDHIRQVMELADSLKELAVGLTEIFLTHVSHRTNEVMKVLTLMASVFIPLTFIAGVYGMNFQHMPELDDRIAYPLVLAGMAAVAAAMVAYFRRRGWIGRSRRRRQ